MNRLSKERQAQVVRCLVEGNSIRATVRMTGVAKNTITKLLVDLGEACSLYQHKTFRDLPCERIQCDEIWAFCYAKEKNVPEDKSGQFGYGDVYTFTAICADTKLVPSWYLGKRDVESAKAFIWDLAARLKNRVQLTTDGLRAYQEAVFNAFGMDVDFGQLIKTYAKDRKDDETKYSPPRVAGIEAKRLNGFPDPKHVSTSYVERQNLTMRMSMRRFTRLTNAFSKKLENLAASVSLHFMYYNFARPHQTLSKPYPKTPAMAAGVSDHVWSIEEIVGLLDYGIGNQGW